MPESEQAGSYEIPGYPSMGPPLPAPPRFPLFGLDATFQGPRWLAIWQPLVDARAPIGPGNEVSNVVLGHGDRAWVGPFVLVGHSFRSGQMEPSVEAAFGAQFGVLNAMWSGTHAVADQSERQRLLDEADSLSRHLDAPPWEATEVLIDGRATLARNRSMEGGAWATVVGVSSALYLGIAGSSHDPKRLSLTQVSGGTT